ncbi:peptide ABC transporter substrate-binding protein [Oleisolibacter albus]|uniref:peptide ABC transporter substrate-binding protein n=1 Tax=Oleisolibacter albus TaxID=2171757 RepID=UPI000DF3E9F8|nr:peptide ABC transporter substrate-binding protein [Oleisolibacter albus]
MRIGPWVAAVLAAAGLVLASPAWADMVFHRGNGAEPETLDPQKSTGEGEAWIQYDLFEGLMTVDARGKLIPGVAERWEVAADRVTYTFHLRPDALWSDGTPVTAEDFVFAWRRLVSPRTSSRYAFFLWTVKNAEKISKGQMPEESLGAEAVDARTLRVTLEAPTSWFVAGLQHHSTYPLSKANLQKYGDDFIKPGNLVGNGAFILAESVPQSHVKLVKNPRFHDAASVALDTVYYYPTENRETELKRYRAGELDVTYEVPDAQIPWVRQNLPGEFRAAPYFSTYYYSINLLNEPWKSNADLRAALSLAIDRQIIVDKVTRAGEAPAFSIVPPGTEDYAAPQPDWAGWTQAQRDAKAQELMRKAGYGKGGKPLDLEIMFNTSENHRAVAIAIASMWQQKLGVKVTLNNQEFKVFLNTRSEHKFKDIARNGWVGDYNDAYTFLSIFQSDVPGQNHSSYHNPDYDRLMHEAAVEIDPARRRDLMQRAEALMLADHQIIPLYTYVTTHLVRPGVKGWEDNLRDVHPSRFVSVSR